MTLGQQAYNAYARFSNGKSLISGEQLPEWKDLPRLIQDTWEYSAQCVIQGVTFENIQILERRRNVPGRHERSSTKGE